MQIILYDLRKNHKKMTQQETADYLGIAMATYRLKEKGDYEFTQDEMFLLAKLFDRRIDEIFLPRTHQIGDKTPKNKVSFS